MSRTEKGWLHPIYRGVYAVGHKRLSLHGRFLAAVKACGPGAVLSHYSAAALWEFLDWDDRHPEVTVLGATTCRPRRIRVHRTGVLEALDVARYQVIPVTSPVRTLVDLASIVPHLPLRRAVRQAQSRQRANIPQLVATLRRLGPRRGVRNLARILATGPAPTRTELEDVVLQLIVGAGLAHPDVNVALVIGGRRVVPDFRWPEERLVVEADGRAWHDHRIAREDDTERQALLEAHGERVLRVTWDQAISRPGETLSRLRAAGAPPR